MSVTPLQSKLVEFADVVCERYRDQLGSNRHGLYNCILLGMNGLAKQIPEEATGSTIYAIDRAISTIGSLSPAWNRK